MPVVVVVNIPRAPAQHEGRPQFDRYEIGTYQQSEISSKVSRGNSEYFTYNALLL